MKPFQLNIKSRLVKNLLTTLGALLLPGGVLLAFLPPEATHQRAALGGLLAGLGATMLAIRLMELLREKLAPGASKEVELAQKDERGQLVTGKATLVTYLVMLFAMIALVLTFLFLEMPIACLLTSGVVVLQAIVMVAARQYYNRKL